MSADIEQIAASKLIGQDRNDTFSWWQLPDPIEHTIDKMTAEGVYDSKPTIKTHAQRDPSFKYVSSSFANFPPRTQFETKPFRQGMHQLLIPSLGRLNFQGIAKCWMPEIHLHFSHCGTS